MDTDTNAQGVPSSSNGTSSTAHLVAQIGEAGGGLNWMSYQEGITGTDCPIESAGLYVPRHNATLFFDDVVGNPPSTGDAFCAMHHRPIERLAADLLVGDVASYVFVTPNLCHDMHGSPMCPSGSMVRMGDDWLAGATPQLLAYVNIHGGVIFIVWDEGNTPPRCRSSRWVRKSSRVTEKHGDDG